jgi:poly-gamma-glutamate synthesis protein (capsule biosynthesis protein)
MMHAQADLTGLGKPVRSTTYPVILLLILFGVPLLLLNWPDAAPPPPDWAGYPWAYTREPQPPADEDAVTVIFVGDLLLGRGVEPNADPLADVADWLAAADLTVGNLEGYITAHPPAAATSTSGPDQPIYLPMPVTAVATLRRAGFDILSVANNHSQDGGPDGLAETVRHLQNGGLTAIGVPQQAALIREVRGVRLAFLAFNTVSTPEMVADWDMATAVAAIAAARQQADAVIVNIHWGQEYEARAAPVQERLAQTLLAAGADLIVGHHPHVVQPIQVTDTAVVAYSLGNLLFDQNHDGLALRAVFDGDGLVGVQALPVWAGIRPHLWPAAEAPTRLQTILPPPPRLSFACDPAACTPVELPPAAQSGRFYGGQIDLTGDGVAETVRLEGEAVVVYAGDTAVWRSPADWRVLDVALGDPNDDGRYEMMLAIWRADGGGYERSQPYMVGYRGVRYDLLWGGRPVGDPIQELALGDVDGDGIEELIVIEELADGSAQAISVWQWEGWTFGLQWRSTHDEPDRRYQNLLFADGVLSVTLD